MENIGAYKVSRPSLMSLLFSMIFSSGILLLNTRNNMEYKVLLYFGYIWSAFCLIVVLILLYRIITIRKFIEVRILPDSIIVENKEIQANQIENIYVKGYFIPVIGIKPVDHKFPPYRLCFSFLDEEYKGMKELTAWAESNQIKLSKKRFMRWL
ncbi:hypothetical protein BSK62_07175 [Paenibacillus odorifer]|uniref:hypothetical protein n=1 Tax=Paenibacillus TaxID=44249 RepID=UPI00096E3F57|nr:MULTISPECIES: hypothetical protein [Paenibacillus]MDH6427904.1 hypothetical protein [Paenibacillus sp. PastH-4]MDH6444468.1 hypothetical protein [Paenibacillus sp. PastF-4]MDH6528367.1 hypothetical protein [Paenibacillus sp. PastH-3]OMD67981.1 hypothetical protein BSK62_07175 [Paenibacillus odorifer]